MIRILGSAKCSVGRSTKLLCQPARCFADVLDIPTDKDRQFGRRKLELEAEAAGTV